MRKGLKYKRKNLPEITMRWRKADMLNDPRVVTLFADGGLDADTTKKEIIEALYG